MLDFSFGSGRLQMDPAAARIVALSVGAQILVTEPVPLFALGARDEAGALRRYDSDGATLISAGDGVLDYALPDGLSVRVALTAAGDALEWRVSVGNTGDLLVEWVECPRVKLPALTEDGGIGAMLYPYNEGALITNGELRAHSGLPYSEPEYPSLGRYGVFPNMVFAQFMAYLTAQGGLYIGAHDPARGVKSIDFQADPSGVTPLIRIYCGELRGADWAMDYPIVFAPTGADWTDSAERYRAWFEQALPPRCRKIADNPALPEWYGDSPVVVSYPVRGIHDMDTMTPNALFPYCAALPLIQTIRESVQNRLLVLLMHWEGTAPWAPPYVWPPFGGEAMFTEFRDALHRAGDLLGVYCSGFGYTVQSNLIADYNREADIRRRSLKRAMCAGPDGKVGISRICTAQRSGFDICPACESGRALLREAYEPLFSGAVDYAQILDQNHGGGQYFCYATDHGHPPTPGPWMTSSMQETLGEWNVRAEKTLFGCESSAAEPFIGNLLFSDNRYELNYRFGVPVPLYAYLYHEYVRNFMGNQVSCPFPATEDTFRMRMAYSFAAGDCLTFVLAPDGELMSNWGTRDFEHHPDREKAFAFARTLMAFYRDEAKPYLYNGRMIPAHAVRCDEIEYHTNAQTVRLPKVFATAWEANGTRVQILVNYTDEPVVCTVDGQSVTVPAAAAVRIAI